jgi:AraC family transcriptional regulator
MIHLGWREPMETACSLLAKTDASLTSIAQEVGYAGQSAFGAVFRTMIGLPPGQYRRTARGGTEIPV